MKWEIEIEIDIGEYDIYELIKIECIEVVKDNDNTIYADGIKMVFSGKVTSIECIVPTE